MSNRLKVLGILNSDWNSEKDGGRFICDVSKLFIN